MLNFYMPHVSFLHKTVVILPIKVIGELPEACMLCPLPLWDAKLPPLTCCRRSCKAKLRTSRLGVNGLPNPWWPPFYSLSLWMCHFMGWICRSFPLWDWFVVQTLWLVCCTPFQASTENFKLTIKKISNFIFYYWLCNWNLNMPLFFSHIDSYMPHPLKWISYN